MKKEIKKKIIIELKKKKFVIGCPVTVKFKMKDGSTSRIEATKGTEVIKWGDLLKSLRERK